MPLFELDKFMATMRRLESGSYQGNYSAQPREAVPSGQYAGERAYGAYQIMPGNWPHWAAEAGVPGADITDPQAQDTVARYKFRQYYQKYGDWRLVAIAWFAGGTVADRAVRDGFASISNIGDYLGTNTATYLQDFDKYWEESPVEAAPAIPGYNAPYPDTTPTRPHPDPLEVRYGSGGQLAAERGQNPPIIPGYNAPYPPGRYSRQPFAPEDMTYQVSRPSDDLAGYQPDGRQPVRFRPATMQDRLIGLMSAISEAVRRSAGVDVSAPPSDLIRRAADRGIGGTRRPRSRGTVDPVPMPTGQYFNQSQVGGGLERRYGQSGAPPVQIPGGEEWPPLKQNRTATRTRL